MEGRWCYAILSLCVLAQLALNSQVSGAFADKKRLMADLLTDYNKLLSPEVGPNNNVQVKQSLQLLHILDFADNVLTLDAYQSMFWFDNQLQWDPAEYANIDTIHVPSKLLWKPDVMLMSNADDAHMMNDEGINAVVTYDGHIHYITPGKVKTYCATRSELRPGDIVSCSLKYSSWTYDGTKLDLDTYQNAHSIETSFYDADFNRHWKLESSTAKRNVHKYDCCPESYIDITYTLYLKYVA